MLTSPTINLRPTLSCAAQSRASTVHAAPLAQPATGRGAPGRSAATARSHSTVRYAAAAVLAIASPGALAAIGPSAARQAAPDDVIYADGVEDCSAMDRGDLDRLTECEEWLHHTDALDPDSDDDGLSDGDEVHGAPGGLNLPAYGVKPTRRDLLLEYDWFDDANEPDFPLAGTNCATPHSHRPTPAMLDIVRLAYADAPVLNPDGTTGIHVVQDVGQHAGGAGTLLVGGTLVPDADGNILGGINDAEALAIHQAQLAPNRRGYFHHVLFAHRYKLGNYVTSSGHASRTSPRALVTLYCYATTPYVAQTIIHEVGHNFGLRHGGDTDCNWKPNYNSLMNYRFQFDGIDLDCDARGDGVPTYSAGKRITLDENHLDESEGVCGVPAGVPIAWQPDGILQLDLALDVNGNYDYPNDSQIYECGGTQTTLRDYDDWANIELARGVGTPDGGNPPPEPQPAPCRSPEHMP